MTISIDTSTTYEQAEEKSLIFNIAQVESIDSKIFLPNMDMPYLQEPVKDYNDHKSVPHNLLDDENGSKLSTADNEEKLTLDQIELSLKCTAKRILLAISQIP